PVLRDADAKWYVREERGGWILGPYERGAPARFVYGVPDSFRADLFDLDLERTNVNGGAIALGHPIGATGARIVVTLLHEMARRESRLGLATLCVSGGLGTSVLVERPSAGAD
ncbi:MAG: hypothetical protein KY397_06490, partial [Gemmatimonadetes bacterium]|nr:hypothetical protein [Gemmatimonadota bacterium]